MATKRPKKKSAAKKTAAKKSAKKKSSAKSPRDALTRLRQICLALPEAHEVEAWGEPTFRVRNKLFAMHSSAGTHHGRGRPGVWIASTHVTQDLVLRARPDRYFSPPYVGPSGWIGAWLDKSPLWSEIAELLRDAYRLKAPKKLADTVDD
jgi:hypothetical protein